MEKTFMARKMEKVGPNQKQRFTSCDRNVAGGTPAGARTGVRARSAHRYAGACGEGATRVTVGEVVRSW